MPLPERTFDQWEVRLAEWATRHMSGAPISSAYRGPIATSSASSTLPRGAGAMDVERMMQELERKLPHAHRALVAWVKGPGSRGEQAARLSLHRNVYRERVRAAITYLEALSRQRPKRQAK